MQAPVVLLHEQRNMKPLSLLPSIAALSLFAPDMALAQGGEGDHKVRIDITRNENGETSHIVREFDLNDEQGMQNALRELGVMEELNMLGKDEDLIIDVRRMKEGGLLNDMSLAFSMLDGESAELPERRAYMGVDYGDYDPGDRSDKSKQPPIKSGCVLTSVEENDPAWRAGLRANDVIVDMNGHSITDGNALVTELREHTPGDVVKVVYYRGKNKNTTDLTLGEREEEVQGWNFNWNGAGSQGMDWNAYFNDNWDRSEPKAFLGVSGEDNTNGTGVRVTEVTEGSSAAAMGLLNGDVIERFNGETIKDFSELAEQIADLEPGEEVNMVLTRNGERVELDGSLGAQFDVPDAPSFPGQPCMPAIPPMPPMPNLSGTMSAKERADFEQSMAEFEQEMEEYQRDLEQQARDMSEHDRDMEEHDRDMEQHGRDMEQFQRDMNDSSPDRAEFRREMEELRREMDILRRELRSDVVHEARMRPPAAELSPEDTQLLRSQGVNNLARDLGWNDLRITPDGPNGQYRLAFLVSERGDLAVDVHNAKGERVYHEAITGFKGAYERLLDLSDLPDGTYFLVVGQGDATETRKLQKQ